MVLNTNPRQSRRVVGVILTIVFECIIILLAIYFTNVMEIALSINYSIAIFVILLVFSIDTDGVYKALAVIYLLFFPVISTISLLFLFISIKKQNQLSNIYNECGYEYAHYFSSGEDFYKNLIEKLSLARKRIYLEFYIVKNGKVWQSIKNILIKKAQDGVSVKLCFDGFGSYGMPKKLKKWLISHKIDHIPYNPLRILPDLFLGCRSHRKIAVIDDFVYLGGVNLADEYVNIISPFGKWKDCAVLFKGEISNVFAGEFLRQFSIQTKEKDTFISPLKSRVIFDTAFTQSAYKNTLIELINNNKTIEIVTPYFAPDFFLLETIKFAIQNGKIIRIYLPGIPDKKFIYQITKHYAEELANYGAEIYIYKPGFLHSKLCLTENNALIGSANVDYRSFYLQRECAVLTDDENIVSAVKNDINQIIKNSESPLFPIKTANFFVRYIRRAVVRIVAPLI